MKDFRFALIAALLVGLPLSAVVYQTVIDKKDTRPRWLWKLNVFPVPFVLSDSSYLRDYQVDIIFDDGSKVHFNRVEISRRVFHSRLDRTVFAHLIRSLRRATLERATTPLKHVFCEYKGAGKSVVQFTFSVTAADADIIMKEHFQCP